MTFLFYRLMKEFIELNYKKSIFTFVLPSYIWGKYCEHHEEKKAMCDSQQEFQTLWLNYFYDEHLFEYPYTLKLEGHDRYCGRKISKILAEQTPEINLKNKEKLFFFFADTWIWRRGMYSIVSVQLFTDKLLEEKYDFYHCEKMLEQLAQEVKEDNTPITIQQPEFL